MWVARVQVRDGGPALHLHLLHVPASTVLGWAGLLETRTDEVERSDPPCMKRKKRGCGHQSEKETCLRESLGGRACRSPRRDEDERTLMVDGPRETVARRSRRGDGKTSPTLRSSCSSRADRCARFPMPCVHAYCVCHAVIKVCPWRAGEGSEASCPEAVSGAGDPPPWTDASTVTEARRRSTLAAARLGSLLPTLSFAERRREARKLNRTPFAHLTASGPRTSIRAGHAWVAVGAREAACASSPLPANGQIAHEQSKAEEVSKKRAAWGFCLCTHQY